MDTKSNNGKEIKFLVRTIPLRDFFSTFSRSMQEFM